MTSSSPHPSLRPSRSSSASSSFNTPSRIPSLIQNLSTSTPTSSSAATSSTHSSSSTTSTTTTTTISTFPSYSLPPTNNNNNNTLSPSSTLPPLPQQEPFSSPSSIISTPPSTSTTPTLTDFASNFDTQDSTSESSDQDPLPIIKKATLEAIRDGDDVMCTWLVSAELLGANNGGWTLIPLISNSVALESSEIISSPNPNMASHVTTRGDKICLLANEEGHYEVILKFIVPTEVFFSKSSLMHGFIVPAPSSPVIVLSCHVPDTNVKVTAKRTEGDRDEDIFTKILCADAQSCKLPPCDEIRVCWNVTPQEIEPVTFQFCVSSINAKWTVGQKKITGIIDVEVFETLQESENNNAIVDLSLWLTSKENNSVLKVEGSRVLSWTHTITDSEPRQRLFVLLRLANSSPSMPLKFSVIMELSADLSLANTTCAIPLVIGTNGCDSDDEVYQYAAKVRITTDDETIQLRQLPHSFATATAEEYESDSTNVPALTYNHPSTCESSNVLSPIAISAFRHQYKPAKSLPIFVEAVQSKITLSRIADGETRAAVYTLMKIRVPTKPTADRKGRADAVASPLCRLVVALTPSSPSTKIKPIELWSITANGEKINNACIRQDESVTKLSIPFLILPPAPSTHQQNLPPFSPRSAHLISNAYQEDDTAPSAGRSVEVRLSYMTEVIQEANGNGNAENVTLPLPSFDVPVGTYDVFVGVNDDSSHCIEITGSLDNSKVIYFKQIRKDFESACADQLPFSSITCSSETRSSGIFSDSRLGGVASYVPSKTAAMMRDQISGLGKRDKGPPNVDVRSEVATKVPERETECEDIDETTEMEGSGWNMDIYPVHSKSTYAFETVLLPSNMFVLMRFRISDFKLDYGFPQSLPGAKAASNKGLTISEPICQEASDEHFEASELVAQKAPDESAGREKNSLDTNILTTMDHIINQLEGDRAFSQHIAILILSLVGVICLSLVGVYIERGVGRGESSTEIVSFVASFVQNFFKRRQHMV